MTLGFRDIADQSLQWIGRISVWLLLSRRCARDESAFCAVTGGALLCTGFGGVVGFAPSDHSRNIGANGETTLGVWQMCVWDSSSERL